MMMLNTLSARVVPASSVVPSRVTSAASVNEIAICETNPIASGTPSDSSFPLVCRSVVISAAPVPGMPSVIPVLVPGLASLACPSRSPAQLGPQLIAGERAQVVAELGDQRAAQPGRQPCARGVGPDQVAADQVVPSGDQ